MKKFITLLAGFALMLATGCCTAHRGHTVAGWEYLEVFSLERANEFAKQGWVVDGYSVYHDGGDKANHAFLLKRARK